MSMLIMLKVTLLKSIPTTGRFILKIVVPLRYKARDPSEIQSLSHRRCSCVATHALSAASQFKSYLTIPTTQNTAETLDSN